MFYRPRKVEVTLRLDDDVVPWFEGRHGNDSDGCDAEVNRALRDYVVCREREAAVACLAESDAAFERDGVVEGSDEALEAAAHAVAGAAFERRWPFGDRRLLKSAAVRLASAYEDQMIAAGYAGAEEFSRHQSRDWMEDWERDANRPLVREFVVRVVRLN